MDLITALKEKKQGKSYRVFADELGLSLTNLFAVLEKGRPIGMRFLSAVTVHLPELDTLVLQYLRERYDGSMCL